MPVLILMTMIMTPHLETMVTTNMEQDAQEKWLPLPSIVTVVSALLTMPVLEVSEQRKVFM